MYRFYKFKYAAPYLMIRCLNSVKRRCRRLVVPLSVYFILHYKINAFS